MNTTRFIDYDENTLSLTKIYYGADEDYARDRDGEVEMIWSVSSENLQKLKKVCQNAKTTQQVADYLTKRFADEDGKLYDFEIRQWWDKKGIEYSFWTYP